jgi:hypothetical protein
LGAGPAGKVDFEPFISGVRLLEDVVGELKVHGRQEGNEYVTIRFGGGCG